MVARAAGELLPAEGIGIACPPEVNRQRLAGSRVHLQGKDNPHPELHARPIAADPQRRRQLVEHERGWHVLFEVELPAAARGVDLHEFRMHARMEEAGAALMQPRPRGMRPVRRDLPTDRSVVESIAMGGDGGSLGRGDVAAN